VHQRLPFFDAAFGALDPRFGFVRRDLEGTSGGACCDPLLEPAALTFCGFGVLDAVAVSGRIDRDGGEAEMPDEPPREAEDVRDALVLRPAVPDEDGRDGPVVLRRTPQDAGDDLGL